MVIEILYDNNHNGMIKVVTKKALPSARPATRFHIFEMVRTALERGFLKGSQLIKKSSRTDQLIGS